MISLDKDLQKNKNSLEDFFDISKRVRAYLPNVLSDSVDKNGYTIYVSEVAGSKRYLRPINKSLYIQDDTLFEQSYSTFLQTLSKIKSKELHFNENEKNNINSFLYTVQQSIGAGLDLMVDPNSARKHVGNRFEELIRVVFTAIGISNKRIVLRIPYDTDEGRRFINAKMIWYCLPTKKYFQRLNNWTKTKLLFLSKRHPKIAWGKCLSTRYY